MWVQATLERVCDIIRADHPDLAADELRSEAFGWLARPAELLALLVEHTVDDGAASSSEPEELNRAIALPRDLLEALHHHDLSTLRPRTTLYVHLSASALRPARTADCGYAADGVARVEGLGAFGLEQLPDLLAHTRLRVLPVVDLSDRVRSTAYEHPEALKDRVRLLTGGDYWPFGTTTSRRVDFDHPTPSVHPPDRPPGDPPGRADPPGPLRARTGTHNSGPLGRRHHRWKTHAGFRARQCGENRYVWLTPHGLAFLVDHTGTHRLDPEQARTMLDAPTGVDVHPTDPRVMVDLPAAR